MFSRRPSSKNEENISKSSSQGSVESVSSIRNKNVRNLLAEQNPNVSEILSPSSRITKPIVPRMSSGSGKKGRGLSLATHFRSSSIKIPTPGSKKKSAAKITEPVVPEVVEQAPTAKEEEEEEVAVPETVAAADLVEPLKLDMNEDSIDDYGSLDDGSLVGDAPEDSVFEEEDDSGFLEVAAHTLVHSGHKLFWRLNRTIDFRVFLGEPDGAVVVRSFDPVSNAEFPPILLDLGAVLEQVTETESAMAAHQSSLDGFTASKKSAAWQGKEDDTLKERKMQRESRRRRSAKAMTAAECEKAKAKQAVKDMVQQKSAQRKTAGKIASFVINRFEADKDKATGEIVTKIAPRPNDNFTEQQLWKAVATEGVLNIGRGVVWNKQENAMLIRQTSAQCDAATVATSEACKKASDQQKSVKAALDVVKALSDRKHFDNLPPTKQKFQLVVRKALFQQRLERVQDTLDQSATYAAFEEALPKDLA